MKFALAFLTMLSISASAIAAQRVQCECGTYRDFGYGPVFIGWNVYVNVPYRQGYFREAQRACVSSTGVGYSAPGRCQVYSTAE